MFFLNVCFWDDHFRLCHVYLPLQSRAVSVLWEDLYADWQGSCRAFSWRCFDSCAATALSTILDRKWRFDTGLKFLRSSGLREGFFRRGVTCATLTCAGTTPDVSERFTMLLIAGRSTSICSMRSEVGMGFNAHNLAGDQHTV